MKRRALIATVAAGASLASSPLCRSAEMPVPISFDEAITIALHEMHRRGLSETHHVAALHGAPDATAEGAAFAASIFPRADAPRLLRNASARLKLLIERDGRVSVRSWRARNSQF